jgi:Tfp pilus assembly protein PilN
VKPVNLLPEQHRPKVASGMRSGIAYKAIGGLAVILLAVVAYVTTTNDISSKNQQATELQRQADAATAQAGSLGPVSNFLEIKQAREQSIRDLAGRRFDWERLTREVARVLPAGSFVTDLSASVDGKDASSSSTTPAAAAGAGAAAPTLTLSGCALSQSQVATLLVRLKQLHLAQDATLVSSSRVDAATGAASSTGTGTGAAVCTKYEYKASVTFDPASVAGADMTGKRVPASLGGGQ